MINGLGGAVGYGVGQMVEGPTLEEAEAKVVDLLGKMDDAVGAYQFAKSSETAIAPELMAHRAQVLANLAGEFAQAAYTLQRAAFAKATK